jgi:hypothetical protein
MSTTASNRVCRIGNRASNYARMPTLIRASVVLIASAMHVAAAVEPQERALAGALRLAKATQELDAAKIVNLMLPDVVSAAGGASKMRSILAHKFAQAKSVGMVVDSVTLGLQTAMGKDGGTCYIFFPYITEAHSNAMKVTDEAFYLAISDDSGKTWYYVDGLELNEEIIKTVFLRGYQGVPPLPKRERRVEQK